MGGKTRFRQSGTLRRTASADRKQAAAQVEATLAKYAEKKVPRIHAIRAGIRGLESRGVQHVAYGRYALAHLRKLLEEEEAFRRSR